MTENFYLTGECVSDSEPYEYRSCGLDGIFLLNVIEKHSYDDENYITIKDIDGLHVAIGKHLVTHRKALVPAEIKFLRKTMELTQSELAEGLGKSSQSVARWEKGIHEIPGATLQRTDVAHVVVGRLQLNAGGGKYVTAGKQRCQRHGDPCRLIHDRRPYQVPAWSCRLPCNTASARKSRSKRPRRFAT